MSVSLKEFVEVFIDFYLAIMVKIQHKITFADRDFSYFLRE